LARRVDFDAAFFDDDDLATLRLALFFDADFFPAERFAPPRRAAALVDRADADRLELPRLAPARFFDFAAPAFLRDFLARVAIAPSPRRRG
jgi:hypothetical protein